MQHAIERQAVQSRPFQTGRVLTISLGHAVHDTYTAFLAPLLPLFIANFALSKTEAGLLNVFMQVPSLLQPAIGYLADRVSLRYVVIVAPGLSAAMMSLLGIAPSYAILALLLLVVGLSSAGLHAVAPVTIGRQSGDHLGRGMSFWMVGGELGRTLGPIVVVSAVELLGLIKMPVLMILGLLTSALLYLRLKDLSEALPAPATNVQRLPWRQLWRGMGPLLAALMGIILARVFLLTAITTYLPTFLTEEGADLWFAGASLSLLEAAGVVGALLGGSLSDRLGRRRVLGTAMLASPLCLFAFLATSGPARLLIMLLLGFTALSITPVVMALVQESFPHNRALANGLYMALSFLSRSGAVVLLGVLSDLFGMQPAFFVSAIISLLGLPFVLLLPRGRAAT